MKNKKPLLGFCLLGSLAFCVCSAIGVTAAGYISSEEVSGVNPSFKRIIYLDVSVNLGGGHTWADDDAKFACYVWGSGLDPQFVDDAFLTTRKNSSTVYQIDLPTGTQKLIFFRYNPSMTVPRTSDKWNQTIDITLPSENDNEGVDGATGNTYKITTWRYEDTEKSAGTWYQWNYYLHEPGA